ncbi:MAG: helix-turn-helix transcriptional regulator [Ignavibacteriae bacterium]|uniref:helix-turn-helix domain-containing protein n=1 Tax=uncultured Algibacter sp. TaxID=298659 RepID=UPI001D330B26|nr:helix-turn-helix transcriptional regulator [uncultured Algibacter sp.]MCB0745024.1 helix-turn-helix transcriptional regulator [Ignavibacteriota bacterium]
MKKNRVLDKIRKYRSKYVDIFVDYTFDLSSRIQFLLDQNSMDQKDLAKALGKNESEISKWLSGSHNFTLKTVARIEDVLGNKLLEVVKDEVIIKEEKVDVYFINPEQIYSPSQYKSSRQTGHLKKYSPNYRNTVIADC